MQSAVVSDSYTRYRTRHNQELLAHGLVVHVPPQHEVDYAQGARFMLHSVFLHSLANWFHFVLLPFKLLGLLTLPVYWYLLVRYAIIPPNSGRWTDHELGLRSRARLGDMISFTQMHSFFFACLVALVFILINELSFLLSIFHCLLLVVLSMASPLWYHLSRAIDHALPLRHIGDAFLVLVAPIFCIVQLYILLLPNLYWWASHLQWLFPLLSSLCFSVVGSMWWLVVSVMGLVLSLMLWLFNLLYGNALLLELAPFFAWLRSVALSPASLFPPLFTSQDVATVTMLLSSAITTLTAWLSATWGGWSSLLFTTSSSASVDLSGVSLLLFFPARHFNVDMLRRLIEAFVLPFDTLFSAELWLAQSFYLKHLPWMLRFFLHWFWWLLFNRFCLQLMWFAICALSWFPPIYGWLRALFPAANPTHFALFPLRALRQSLRLGWGLLKLLLVTLRGWWWRILHLQNCTLAYPTLLCARAGLLGDLLLIPIAVAWMGWPCGLVFLRGVHSLYVPGIVFSLTLVLRGRAIISTAWRK